MTELIGRQIEQYRILALEAEGGMGAVYRAEDVNLQRNVAIKVMHAYLARQDQFQQRFMQEAKAAAQLDHPSIVRILEFGNQEGLLFMVMEYIPSGSLGEYIRQLHGEGKLVQLDEILFLLAQVSDALGYAHGRGVIHRDMKPDNVLLKRLEKAERAGEPPLRSVVTDFGLAKLLEGGMHTGTDSFMGTLDYMAPEQALGGRIDGRADLYALGVILYELATGQLPFKISTAAEAIQKLQWSLPASPREINPDLPQDVATIILKALAKKPDERYQTGEEMARALRNAAGNMSIGNVARFQPVARSASLLTRVQRQPELSPEMPTVMMPGDAAFAGRALFVARKGQPPQRYRLDKPALIMGRDPDNDVVLDEGGVSRRHARLEQTVDGWQVTDMGSSNGTWLSESRLLPDVPEPWRPGQLLRIGVYHLSIQDTPGGDEVGTIVMAGMAEPTNIPMISGRIGAVVNPSELTIVPGQLETAVVELINQDVRVSHYSARIDGIPASWCTLPAGQTQLMPGESAALPISFHPPQDSSALAGQYNLQLILLTQDGGSISLPMVLIIEPYYQFQSDLHPRNVNHGRTTRLTVQNLGNAPAQFYLSVNDPAEKVTYQTAQPELYLEPGTEETAQVKIRAKERPMLGSSELLPFEALVTPIAGEAQSHGGQLRLTPFVPRWALPLIGLLLLVCCCLTVVAAQQLFSRNLAIAQTNETATAELATAISADETATATVQTATAVALASADNAAFVAQTQAKTATAIASANAETATAAAATASFLGDDDGDGLSNKDELETHLTLPDNPDTDGDGLNDGDEVNTYSTSPLIVDTDQDGLSDFDEVLRHNTNPNNPDKDLDRLLDGTEIAIGTDPKIWDTDGDGCPDGAGNWPDCATPVPGGTPGPNRTIIGQSVRGVPLEVVKVGDGPHRVLLVGGIHGAHSPGSVQLATEAIAHFQATPGDVPAGSSLYILSSLNPDSLGNPGTTIGRLNANGVDLNRNWDCDWTQNALISNEVVNGSGGTAPFSEPESIALRDFVLSEGISEVVFWIAAFPSGLVSPGSCDRLTSRSIDLAAAYGSASGYGINNLENMTGVINGDASNWLDDNGVPAVFVLLPGYTEADFSSNLAGILAVLQP